jgi:hypothetical protein
LNKTLDDLYARAKALSAEYIIGNVDSSAEFIQLSDKLQELLIKSRLLSGNDKILMGRAALSVMGINNYDMQSALVQFLANQTTFIKVTYFAAMDAGKTQAELKKLVDQYEASKYEVFDSIFAKAAVNMQVGRDKQDGKFLREVAFDMILPKLVEIFPEITKVTEHL